MDIHIYMLEIMLVVVVILNSNNNTILNSILIAKIRICITVCV